MSVAALGSLLGIEAVGAAVFTLLAGRDRRWGPVAALGLSFGLGLAVLGQLFLATSLAGLPPSAAVVVGAAVVGWAVVLGGRRSGLAAWRWPAPERLSGRFRGLCRGVEAGSLAYIVAAVALVGTVSLLEPFVEWDFISIWGLKAKVLATHPVLAAGYFHDPSLAYSHLDYPLLWPFALAWMWSAAGIGTPAAKLLAPALLAAFAASFHGLLRPHADRTLALLATAALLSLPMLLTQTTRLMADPPLAYFALAAGACLVGWEATGEGVFRRLGGVFAAGLLTTKNEGTVLFAILVMVLAAGLRRRPAEGLRTVLGGWLLVPLALTAPWFAFRATLPNLHLASEQPLAVVATGAVLDRLSDLAGTLPAYLFEPADWSAFWPVAVVGLTLAGPWWRRRDLRHLAALALLPGIAYGGVIVLANWSVPRLLDTAGSRLALHLAPLWLFLLAAALSAGGRFPWAGDGHGDPDRYDAANPEPELETTCARPTSPDF